MMTDNPNAVSTPMILCCGEALIDMLPRKLADGSNVFLPCAGGAVFNTAITLGRLGENVALFTGLSTDMFGEQLTEALEKAGVDPSFARRSQRPTTLAFVQLSDGEARYVFYDENSAGRMIEPDQLPELPPITAAHFGAISLIGEPCGTTYERLASELSKSTVVSLDPNIRPGFVQDEKAYRDRLDRMARLADIIKVSEDDLDWLTSGQSAEAFANSQLAGRCSLVVITSGARGASVFMKSGSFHSDAPATTVADTVGAGDSFNGGLLSGLRQLDMLQRDRLSTASVDDIRPAVNRAMKVAAITVSRAGANPPWANELTTTEAS